MWSLETFSKERLVLKMIEYYSEQELADSLEFVEVLVEDEEGNVKVKKVY